MDIDETHEDCGVSRRFFMDEVYNDLRETAEQKGWDGRKIDFLDYSEISVDICNSELSEQIWPFWGGRGWAEAYSSSIRLDQYTAKQKEHTEYEDQEYFTADIFDYLDAYASVYIPINLIKGMSFSEYVIGEIKKAHNKSSRIEIKEDSLLFNANVFLFTIDYAEHLPDGEKQNKTALFYPKKWKQTLFPHR